MTTWYPIETQRQCSAPECEDRGDFEEVLTPGQLRHMTEPRRVVCYLHVPAGDEMEAAVAPAARLLIDEIHAAARDASPFWGVSEDDS